MTCGKQEYVNLGQYEQTIIDILSGFKLFEKKTVDTNKSPEEIDRLKTKVASIEQLIEDRKLDIAKYRQADPEIAAILETKLQPQEEELKTLQEELATTAVTLTDFENSDMYKDFDFTNVIDREEFNAILIKHISIIKFNNGYLYVKARHEDQWFIEHLDYDIYTHHYLTSEEAEDHLMLRLKDELLPLDSANLKVKTDKELEQYLDYLRKSAITVHILDDYDEGIIDKKRALRLIRQHEIDHPHDLTMFEGMYTRNAIYKKINWNQPMFATVDVKKIKTYEDYLEQSEIAEKLNRERMIVEAEELKEQGLI